ncbi:hypothetical protein JZ751_019498 [Albula glossodonta]|uniref:Nuclear pore complex protein Nup153 n=1 Tax=Albula glossodonta TaxID=121402 RepID=A0A8T2N0W7_9TELE|nr:hypothetical protein JZ751_019498 [Albula glossodonta]
MEEYPYRVAVEGEWGTNRSKRIKNKLHIYFQSKKKSGGGECQVEYSGQGSGRAIVCFKSEDARKRVFEKPDHEITVENATVALRLGLCDELSKEEHLEAKLDDVTSAASGSVSEEKQSGSDATGAEEPAQSRVVVLENVPEQLNKELLAILVENICNVKEDGFFLEMIWDIDVAVVSFHHPSVAALFLAKCDGHKCFRQHRIRTRSLEPTRSVRVENLPPEAGEELLELYFEKEREGGGKVEAIKMLDEEQAAIVTFQDPKVTETVQKSKHHICKALVHVYPYHESLGTALYGRGRPEWKLPQTFSKSLQPALCRFLLSKGHLGVINDQMRSHFCQVELDEAGAKLSPLPALLKQKDLTANHIKGWRGNALQEFRSVMARYRCFEFGVSSSVWKAAKRELCQVVKENAVLQPNEANRVVAIACLAEDMERIQQVVKEIMQMAASRIKRERNSITEEVPLSPIIHYILQQAGLQKNFVQTYPNMSITYRAETQMLALRGQIMEVLAVKSWVLEQQLQMKQRQLELNCNIRDFLTMGNCEEISRNLFASQGVSAGYKMEGEEVVLVASSEKALVDANQLLTSTLACQNIPVEDETVLSHPEWLRMKTQLIESYDSPKGNILCIKMDQPGLISVTGFPQPVKEVCDSLSDFISKHSRVEESVPMQTLAVLRFLEENKAPDWSSLINAMEVWVHFDPKRLRVLLAGPKYQVLEAKTLFLQIADSICTDKVTIIRPGARKYFLEKQQMFTLMMKQHNCVVQLEERKKQEGEEDGDEEEEEEEEEGAEKGTDNSDDKTAHTVTQAVRDVCNDKQLHSEQCSSPSAECQRERTPLQALEWNSPSVRQGSSDDHRTEPSGQRGDLETKCTNEGLNIILRMGNIEEALAAGPEIQSAVRREARRGVANYGDVLQTSGFCLRNVVVLHIVCPPWDGGVGNAQQTLVEMVQTCLKEAEKQKATSLAFPAIGTGNKGFPKEFRGEALRHKPPGRQSQLAEVNTGQSKLISYQITRFFNGSGREAVGEKQEIVFMSEKFSPTIFQLCGESPHALCRARNALTNLFVKEQVQWDIPDSSFTNLISQEQDTQRLRQKQQLHKVKINNPKPSTTTKGAAAPAAGKVHSSVSNTLSRGLTVGFKFNVGPSSSSSSTTPASTSSGRFTFCTPLSGGLSEVFKFNMGPRGAGGPGTSSTPGTSNDLPSELVSTKDKIKNPEGAWECCTCLVENKAQDSECVSCQSVRPVPPSEASTPTLSGGRLLGLKAELRKLLGSWTCNVCYMQNDANALKCMACLSNKPEAKVESKGVASSVVSTPILSGGRLQGLKAELRKLLGDWTCNVCCVQNKANALKCMGCLSNKPEAKVESKGFGAPTLSSSASVPTLTISNQSSSSSCSTDPAPASSGGVTFGSPDGLTFGTPISGGLSEGLKLNVGPSSSSKLQSESTSALPSQAGTPLSGVTALNEPPKGSWLCEMCLFQNKAEATKCICCETPKPGTGVEPTLTLPAMTQAQAPPAPPSSNNSRATTTSTPGTPSTPETPSTSNDLPSELVSTKDKIKNPEGAWECCTCLVENKAQDSECVSCQSAKPGMLFSTPLSGGLSEGLKFKSSVGPSSLSSSTDPAPASSGGITFGSQGGLTFGTPLSRGLSEGLKFKSNVGPSSLSSSTDPAPASSGGVTFGSQGGLTFGTPLSGGLSEGLKFKFNVGPSSLSSSTEPAPASSGGVTFGSQGGLTFGTPLSGGLSEGLKFKFNVGPSSSSSSTDPAPASSGGVTFGSQGGLTFGTPLSGGLSEGLKFKSNVGPSSLSSSTDLAPASSGGVTFGSQGGLTFGTPLSGGLSEGLKFKFNVGPSSSSSSTDPAPASSGGVTFGSQGGLTFGTPLSGGLSEGLKFKFNVGPSSLSSSTEPAPASSGGVTFGSQGGLTFGTPLSGGLSEGLKFKSNVGPSSLSSSTDLAPASSGGVTFGSQGGLTFGTPLSGGLSEGLKFKFNVGLPSSSSSTDPAPASSGGVTFGSQGGLTFGTPLSGGLSEGLKFKFNVGLPSSSSSTGPAPASSGGVTFGSQGGLTFGTPLSGGLSKGLKFKFNVGPSSSSSSTDPAPASSGGVTFGNQGGLTFSTPLSGGLSKGFELNVNPSSSTNLESEPTPAPPSQAETPLSGVTALNEPPKGSWLCEMCLVQNKAEATKCICCETPKAGTGAEPPLTLPAMTQAQAPPAPTSSSNSRATTPSTPGTSSTPGTPSTPGTSNDLASELVSTKDKIKNPEGAWECCICLVENKAQDSECVSCQSAKPDNSEAPPHTWDSIGSSDLKQMPLSPGSQDYREMLFTQLFVKCDVEGYPEYLIVFQ